ncbi:MAG: hypothetical protein AABY22_29000 [Nanoarchaeota archaeon]
MNKIVKDIDKTNPITSTASVAFIKHIGRKPISVTFPIGQFSLFDIPEMKDKKYSRAAIESNLKRAVKEGKILKIGSRKNIRGRPTNLFEIKNVQ